MVFKSTWRGRHFSCPALWSPGGGTALASANGGRGGEAARADEAALALTQNAGERACLVTALAAEGPGHLDGVAGG
jgi:hypothetical protein